MTLLWLERILISIIKLNTLQNSILLNSPVTLTTCQETRLVMRLVATALKSKQNTSVIAKRQHWAGRYIGSIIKHSAEIYIEYFYTAKFICLVVSQWLPNLIFFKAHSFTLEFIYFLCCIFFKFWQMYDAYMYPSL